MKKTIAQQLQALKWSLSVWRKAFDSKEGKIIFIRKTRPEYFTSSDVWEVRGSADRLYSVPGTIPLYVTMVK